MEQQLFCNELEYYAVSKKGNGIFDKLFAQHPDEDEKSYWLIRKNAETLGQRYGIVFIVYSSIYSEYRSLDWKLWTEEYKNQCPTWSTIGYYEKDNGWFD